MNSNQAENRELTLAISINPKKPTKRGCYLALTFGTLLSSQGADAHETRPSRPSFAAAFPLYTALRSGRPGGLTRGPLGVERRRRDSTRLRRPLARAPGGLPRHTGASGEVRCTRGWATALRS